SSRARSRIAARRGAAAAAGVANTGSGRRVAGGRGKDEVQRDQERMNLIIVGRPGATPRVLAFGHGRAKVMAICGLGAVIAVIAGFGAFLGARFLGPALLTRELDEARTQLQAQHEELGRVTQPLTRDLDALAVRLGKLQAETTRLNALGERLAKLGKLDDGEFNFREEPAMGGPEAPVAQAEVSKTDLEKALG